MVHAIFTITSLLVIVTLVFMAKSANWETAFVLQLILTAAVHTENVMKGRVIASILTPVQNVNYLPVRMTARATVFVFTQLVVHLLAFACMALRVIIVKTLAVVRPHTATGTVLVIET
jgi:hypothetical protein